MKSVCPSTPNVRLNARDFAYWDELENGFRTDKGTYEILFAASSAEIRARASVEQAHDHRFGD